MKCYMNNNEKRMKIKTQPNGVFASECFHRSWETIRTLGSRCKSPAGDICGIIDALPPNLLEALGFPRSDNKELLPGLAPERSDPESERDVEEIWPSCRRLCCRPGPGFQGDPSPVTGCNARRRSLGLTGLDLLVGPVLLEVSSR